MRLVGLDTETFLGRPGLSTPKVVCLSIFDEGEGSPELYHMQFDREEAKKRLLELLWDPEVHFVGHNLAYDMCCLSNEFPGMIQRWFELHDLDRIYDTQTRQKLRYLAEGRFRWDHVNKQKTYWNLGAVAQEWLGMGMTKTGGVRESFHALWDTPLAEWPDEYITYAVTDAIAPVQIWHLQSEPGEALIPYSLGDGEIVNEHEQNKAALSLYLTSNHGMIADPVRVAALRASLEREVEACIEKLWPTGFFRTREGNKNLREIQYAIFRAYDGDPPLGDAGQEILDGNKDRSDESKLLAFLQEKGIQPEFYEEEVETKKGKTKTVTLVGDPWWKIDRASYSSDVCIKSGDPDLKLLGETLASINELNNFIPVLERGTGYPVTTYYNPLIITGRTSSSRPNIQNLPRRPGVRECFVPREGKVFIFCDYDSLEVRTWAQCCLEVVGFSTAAENYRKDPNWDPHTYMAAAILGDLTYEEAMKIKKNRRHPRHKEVKNARQLAKVPNFGLPGGMGAVTLVEYAYGYGIELTEEYAQWLKDLWKEVFPEEAAYFADVAAHVNSDGVCVQVFSNRQRGGCGYCDFANSRFQGLAADLAKDALYRVTRACYARPDSPLYGARPVAFIHDEIVLEVDEEFAHEAALELQRLMLEPASKWCPDVPILAGVAMARRWYKGAEAVYDDNGRLIPWEPLEGEE